MSSTMAFRPAAAPTEVFGPLLRPGPGAVEPPPAHAQLPVHMRPPPPPGPGQQSPSWWWVSCHGGSGATTVARLVPGGWEAGRAWPNPHLGGPPGVMLVCRSNAYGLGSASDAIRQWASGLVPAPVTVWGLVVVADAPGRLPRRLSAMSKRLSGTVSRMWFVPWVETWRSETPSVDTAPSEIARLGASLHSPLWMQSKIQSKGQ